MAVDQRLQQLDQRTPTGSTTLTLIASDDRLVCDKSPETLIEAATDRLSFSDLTYVFESCTILIARLEPLLRSTFSSLQHQSESTKSDHRLQNEKFVANLLHLLHRLQTVVFLILIRKTRNEINGSALRYTSEHVQRNEDKQCLKEWAGGCQPLSTTWPWSIRPSLMILWVSHILLIMYFALTEAGSLLDVLPIQAG